MFNKVINLFLMACMLSGTASFSVNAADDLIDQWYMQPRLNIEAGRESHQLLNHQGISLGNALNTRINLEINLLSDPLDNRTDSRGIVIDGRYYLQRTGQFTPYIAGGFGRLKNNQLNMAYEEQTTNIGMGFEHTLKGNGTKILADVRYFIDERQNSQFDAEQDNDWAFSLGVSIPLEINLFK